MTAWDEEVGGEHKGHFQISTWIVVRGRRRQSILHISQRSIFFRQRGSGILGTGCPWKGAANGVGEGGGCRRG